MKKIGIICFLLFGVLRAIATPPDLAMENLFDGRYNNNKKIETTIFKNNGMYYRSFTINGDEKVISEIQDVMNLDKENCYNFIFHQDKEASYTSMQFINNGEKIFSGLQIDSPGYGFFYIQAKEKAFK